jgi:hypothetical protein
MSAVAVPTIRLYGQQSAAPNKCGSCALFRRAYVDPPWREEYPATGGGCGLRFPPWVKLLHTHAKVGSKDSGFPVGEEYVENSNADWTRVEDTESCDFWRASGATYVKDQTWSVSSDGQIDS